MKTTERLFNILKSTQYPVMIVGLHGTGKSEVVAQYAKSIDAVLLDIRLSQYTEGDLVGIPHFDVEKRVSSFFPPEFIAQSAQKRCVVFFDELNRASREVRQAVFQLADSRRLGSLVLHPESVVVAACNPDDERYQVNPLDPAELDRWVKFEFTPTVQEWIDWATDNGVNSQIINYIKNNPKHLDPSPSRETMESMVKRPSRRSWKRLSDSISGPLCQELLFDLAVGCVGSEVGVRFASQFSKVTNVLNPFTKFIEASRLSLEEMAQVLSILGEPETYRTYHEAQHLSNLEAFLKSIVNKEQKRSAIQAIRDNSEVEWDKKVSKLRPSLTSVLYS